MVTSEKMLRKSLSLAYSLFCPNDSQANYHFCLGFMGGRLVGIGQNQPDRPDAKALQIARRFGVAHFQEFPFLHAETDLIARLWGRLYIDRRLAMVNIRLNRCGRMMKSKPCKNCQRVLDLLGVNRVIWSNGEGGFTDSTGVVYTAPLTTLLSRRQSMTLVSEIKTRITAAMRSGNQIEKDLFRVVLGDMQTAANGKELSDDMAVAAVKKVMASLRETVSLGAGAGRDMRKEEQELSLLVGLLPENWGAQQIEAFFLDSDGPEFEQIRDAKTEGQAMGVAMKYLKASKAPVDAADVKAVVTKIRNS